MTVDRSRGVQFVAAVLSHAQNLGYDTANWIIDHFCYRTTTLQEYHQVLGELRKSGHAFHGVTLSEAIVNGRPITTIRMSKPLLVGGKRIEALEIPAPKSGVDYKSGFEHIEVLASSKLKPKDSQVLTGAGTVKFHDLPLSATIAIEAKKELNDWLRTSHLLKVLEKWDPLLSGSLPLKVDIPGSDLDILLSADHIDSASQQISYQLITNGITDHLEWHEFNSRQGPALVATIKSTPIPIELFLSTQPTRQQHGHRHLITEYQLLVEHGEPLRQKVITLKMAGLSTEEAFAAALGITGDPYAALVEYEGDKKYVAFKT